MSADLVVDTWKGILNNASKLDSGFLSLQHDLNQQVSVLIAFHYFNSRFFCLVYFSRYRLSPTLCSQYNRPQSAAHLSVPRERYSRCIHRDGSSAFCKADCRSGQRCQSDFASWFVRTQRHARYLSCSARTFRCCGHCRVGCSRLTYSGICNRKVRFVDRLSASDRLSIRHSCCKIYARILFVYNLTQMLDLATRSSVPSWIVVLPNSERKYYPSREQLQSSVAALHATWWSH